MREDFTVSGPVFLSVVGILVLVIVILTLMIVFIVFYSLKAKYSSSKGQRHSLAGKHLTPMLVYIICSCFMSVEKVLCSSDCNRS